MDSSSAGLGAAREWRWSGRSGRFIASACSTMLIVAAGPPGPRIPKRNPARVAACSNFGRAQYNRATGSYPKSELIASAEVACPSSVPLKFNWYPRLWHTLRCSDLIGHYHLLIALRVPLTLTCRAILICCPCQGDSGRFHTEPAESRLAAVNVPEGHRPTSPLIRVMRGLAASGP